MQDNSFVLLSEHLLLQSMLFVHVPKQEGLLFPQLLNGTCLVLNLVFEVVLGRPLLLLEVFKLAP